MAKKLVITVRWMDGETDVYDDVSSHHEADGVMTIRQFKGWLRGTPEKTWHLSLANIRSFDVKWQQYLQ